MKSFVQREEEEKIAYFYFLQNFNLQKKKQDFETKFRKLLGKEKVMGNGYKRIEKIFYKICGLDYCLKCVPRSYIYRTLIPFEKTML